MYMLSSIFISRFLVSEDVMTMTSVLLSLVLVLVTSVVSDYVGQSVAGEVEAGNFTYYTLRQTGHIKMVLYSITGDADIYVSDASNERPTFMFEEHMMSSATCGLDVVDIPASFSRPVHIGVYGHPNYPHTTFNMDGVIVEETEEDPFSLASYQEESNYPEQEEVKSSRIRRDSDRVSYSSDGEDYDQFFREGSGFRNFIWVLWRIFTVVIEVLL